MSKRFNKTEAEAACHARLRKRLRREPTPEELSEAVTIYRRAWQETGRAVDQALGEAWGKRGVTARRKTTSKTGNSGPPSRRQAPG